MPKNPREIVHGKPWGEWVRDAARAIIAATTPQRRYAMVQAGFFAFQGIAAAELNNGTPFRFGTEELRWIFSMLERQSVQDLKRYPKLQAQFENRRDRGAQRKHRNEQEAIAEQDLGADSDFTGIVTEGSNGRRRVH